MQPRETLENITGSHANAFCEHLGDVTLHCGYRRGSIGCSFWHFCRQVYALRHAGNLVASFLFETNP
jgi:hypothetical protein